MPLRGTDFHFCFILDTEFVRWERCKNVLNVAPWVRVRVRVSVQRLFASVEKQ
jgi:hypothetical protein